MLFPQLKKIKLHICKSLATRMTTSVISTKTMDGQTDNREIEIKGIHKIIQCFGSGAVEPPYFAKAVIFVKKRLRLRTR